MAGWGVGWRVGGARRAAQSLRGGAWAGRLPGSIGGGEGLVGARAMREGVEIGRMA